MHGVALIVAGRKPFIGDAHEFINRYCWRLCRIAMLTVVFDIAHKMLDLALVLQYGGLGKCGGDGVRIDELATLGLEAHALRLAVIMRHAECDVLSISSCSCLTAAATLRISARCWCTTMKASSALRRRA